MIENRNQFYLYDRWFYYLKETDDKICYTSKPNNPQSGIMIEMDRNIKNIEILYLKNKKMISRLSISDITKKNIDIVYKDQEAQTISVHDNIHTNLLVELKTSIIDGRRNIEAEKIKFTKKKKLKKLCYLEPVYPVDEYLNFNEVKIDSPILNYFVDVIDNFNYYISKLNIIMKSKENSIKLEEPSVKGIKNIVIPENIYLYDRNYIFVNKENNIACYENNEDGISNLEIKIDEFMKNLTSITIKLYDEQDSDSYKYILQIMKNPKGIKTTKFSSKKSVGLKLVINGEQQEFKKANFRYDATYDEGDNLLNNNIEIVSKTDNYDLSPHPNITNVYTDDTGNEYRILCQDFAKLRGIASFSTGIFNSIEKKLIKTAEK